MKIVTLKLIEQPTYRDIRWTLKHLYYGAIRYKYPLCCVVRFAIDDWLPGEHRKYGMQAVHRGFNEKINCVPCQIFHKHTKLYGHRSEKIYRWVT